MNSLVAADYGSGSSDGYSSDDNDQHKSIRLSATNANSNNNNNTSRTSATTESSGNFLKNSDSDSCSDSDDEADCKQTNEKTSKNTQILPSASSLLSSTSITGQVFNNPYKVAEIAEIASLEKHVKMVNTDANTQMKNGKKICWNYRKGRCRFGSSCTFAHDSDLNVDVANEIPSPRYDANSSCSSNGTTGFTRPQTKIKKSSNKRPGLGDSIMPSKKVMKNYHNTQ